MLAALQELGERLSTHHEEFMQAVQEAGAANAWFTEENVLLAAEAIRSRYLQAAALQQWLSQYPALPAARPRRLGLILAGNIPLVGFHDVLCAVVSGHEVQVKLSSQDSVLFRFVLGELEALAPELMRRIQVVERLQQPEAVIATGANVTLTHFRRYFGGIPNILRGHRNGVAVLTGSETAEELAALGRDIFSYFGLGCRNVAKLLVPAGYDLTTLFPHWQAYNHIIFHNKYRNNYDYYRAVFLINKMAHLEGPMVLLREDPLPSSPIAVLHYEYYTNRESLESILHRDAAAVQCVVGQGRTPFGQSQFPALNDYADGVDTMQFLSRL